MSKVHLGFRKILFKRLLYIILWHVNIQTLILQFIATLNFSNEPLLWITFWLKNIVKPRFFLISLSQLFLTLLFIITESRQYLKVDPCDNVIRFQYIYQKLSPSNLFWFFVYILRGIISIVVFLITFKYNFSSSTMKQNVKDSDNQITNILIILFINSIWINFMFFIYDFIFRKSFKYFPLVQKQQYIIIPSIIITAKNVSIKSLHYCLIFTVFYLLKGYSFCSLICHFFSIECNITYATLFTPFNLFYLWLLNAFILFNNLILKLLFDIFLTKKINFHVTTDPEIKHNKFTIKDALSVYNVPLLQYLGYYDLNIISQFDSARRKQMFSLSYPGGHPHIWREIYQETVKLITETNDNLIRITSQKSILTESNTKYSADGYYFNMRPLSPRTFIYDKCSTEEKVEETFVQKICNYIKTIRFISYFAEEMKEKQLESALQHYQAVSLACYSLANLAAASKAEDKFGIVQQNLSEIINIFLKFYVTLNKLVMINKKPNSSILQVKRYLTNVVKSCLYKLSIDFGSYVKDLSLNTEDEKLFANFILFKN